MGYLVAQFLNPRLNLRHDEFGGDFDGRLRFLREIIADIRAKTDDRFVVGIRISIDEMDHEGLTPKEVLPICQALDRDGSLDYLSIISGTVASAAGWTQVVPPMFVEPGYLAAPARSVKTLVDIPVMVRGTYQSAADCRANPRQRRRRSVRYGAGRISVTRNLPTRREPGGVRIFAPVSGAIRLASVMVRGNLVFPVSSDQRPGGKEYMENANPLTRHAKSWWLVVGRPV